MKDPTENVSKVNDLLFLEVKDTPIHLGEDQEISLPGFGTLEPSSLEQTLPYVDVRQVHLHDQQSEERDATSPLFSTNDVLEIKLRRSLIIHEMIKAFKDPSTLQRTVILKPINAKGDEEEAEDYGGVFRDILSAFWAEFLKGHAVGEVEWIPLIRHDFSGENWKAVSRIIVKGYKDVNYFPIRINKAFMISCIFGEHLLSDEALFDSFMSFVPMEDKDTLKEALKKDKLDMNGDDKDVLDVLSSLSSKRVPCTVHDDLKTLILEVAHKDIIQTPSYIREAWKYVFSCTKLVESIEQIDELYSKLKTTSKKVLNLLELSERLTSKDEMITFDFLKRFDRTLRQDDLTKFLRYSTGADVVCVENIKVMFTKSSGAGRAIIAHTCGPVLEVPTTYENYAAFQGEFLNTLIHYSGYWNMDIA